MRVRFLASLVLASACAYVACSSDDSAKSAPDAGGTGAAGKNSGGSKSSGGSIGDAGGEGGELAFAGSAPSSGGSNAGEAAGGMSAAGVGNAGAGGESEPDVELPAACPGVLADYTTLLGTEGDDTFTQEQLAGKKLVFGLEGADSFAEEPGDDCLVGGPGDDEFTNPSELANYYVGGAGADTYHVTSGGDLVRIADFQGTDTISLSKATFTFLSGDAGDVPSTSELLVVPGYSAGADSGVTEGTVLLYDPDSGELWQEQPGTANDQHILTILNHDSYIFDIGDFVLE